MSVDIGIIGFPKSGRTTVFNALTHGSAKTGVYTAEAKSPHIGIAKVPDPRLTALAGMFHPQKVVPAEARYVDVGASVRDMAREQGIGGELLNQLSNAAALFHVVRAFRDETIPHVEGSLDTMRDVANMDLELAFSDLAIIERRLKRIEDSLKGAKPTERQGLLREKDLLCRLNSGLENNVPVREMKLEDEEKKAIANYQFLTAKPMLIVVNIDEEQLTQAEFSESELRSRYASSNCNVITLYGELEMELAQLDENEASEMRGCFGIAESGLGRTIKLSYALLGLVSFFTVGPDEVRAWPVKKDTSALKAAGKIHSDMERGFIRAEIISYEELMNCGSMTEARKKGLLRLEGKNYIVQDGDVINFLFNI